MKNDIERIWGWCSVCSQKFHFIFDRNKKYNVNKLVCPNCKDHKKIKEMIKKLTINPL